MDEVRLAYELQGRQRGLSARDPELTAAEQEAASLGVESVDGGGRPRGGPSLPDEYHAEFRNLLGEGRTTFQIRDFLAGQFTPSGAIRLVRR
ncbi:MAG: hypothetical protein ACKVIN_13370 [Longimicrobiales bacterium]